MRHLIYYISRVVHQVERFSIGRNSYIRVGVYLCGEGGGMISRWRESAKCPRREEDKKVQYVRRKYMLTCIYMFAT